MLELLQSNRMQLLVDTLCERLQQPADPFEPTLVVVQSQGIGQWLKVELAERLGIAANVKCMLPAELIWHLYQRVLPTPLPDESPFSRQLMTWRLMQLLPNSTETSIQQYLSAGSEPQLRLYQLSHVIAGLFDQYLIYRPDWIYDWEAGDAVAALPWQSDLWRTLLQEPGMNPELHRANLHRTFLRHVAGGEANLPLQLNVLGIAALPTMHLETLQAVAQHEQVSIYFLNPSEHYWGDIQSEKDMAKKSIRRLLNKEGALEEDDYLEVGNPLLSSTGKQGREFLEQLLEAEGVQSVDLFVPPQDQTVLAGIQRDLLNLEFGGEFYDATTAPPKISRQPHDRSIQIHATHSRLREVEVLMDQILTMVDASNSTIKPADIIVMAPDISVYAPFIQAVFQDKLPFSITDRPAMDESAVLVAFHKLLLLPDSRLTASEVMDLLEIPTIADRFEMSEADVARCQYWIQQSGIRFEMDGQSKASLWSLPADDYNTWRFGLDRLLLGYAMESDAGLYEGTAPFDVNPGDAELIGKLCQLLDLLVHHREQLSLSQSAEAWQATISQLMTDLMAPSTEDEVALSQVSDAMARLVKQTADSRFAQNVTPRLFRHWLQDELQQPPQNRGFVSGRITFATLVPMRSIPYQCVCLLGMNDREFPREDKPLSFDLMANDYRKGDRSRRNDDRYLFLEALLSAGRYFYMSYIGRGQKDNKPKPPSELVSELQDYLARIYEGDFVTEHPLQPFNPRYFEAESHNRSYAQNWYQALIDSSDPVPFVNRPLPADDADQAQNIEQLSAFLRHPARYFLSQKLGVKFNAEEDQLQDTESFTLDGLDKYQLSDSALQSILNGHPIEHWQAQVKASGLILPGPMGDAQLAAELQLAEGIASATFEVSPDEALPYQLVINLNDCELQATIALRGDRHVVSRTGELKARQILDSWIRHLALCADGYDGVTHLISRGSKRTVKQDQLQRVPADEARQHLTFLLDLCVKGSQTPLKFLPQTAYELAKNSDKSLEEALDAAYRKYMSGQAGSELNDPYYNRLFDFPADLDEAFAALAQQIWQPILASMEKSQ